MAPATMQTTTTARVTALCDAAGHEWTTTATVERRTVKRGPHRPRVRERQTLAQPLCPECGAIARTITREA